MYTDCSSRVKWAGLLSDPVNLRQDEHQGGVLSTLHYKRYKNPLLLQLEERHTDVKIGSINIPHMIVADDVARKYGSQQIKIWDVEKKTQRERYCIKVVSEYDQEIPQSQTADNPVAPRGRAAQPSRDTRKTN